MFKKAIIHNPTDEETLKYISKEIASFHCSAAVKYIEGLKLSDKETEALFISLEHEIRIKA